MTQGKKPLTSMVYQSVYDDIINGKLTVNDTLTEGQLIEQLGVSKSPVREALIMLCEENVLQSVPRIGYRVVQIGAKQLEALIDARLAIEPYLLHKAWPKLPGEAVGAIKKRLVTLKADEMVHHSIQDNWRRNIDFHLLLAQYGENEYLSDMLGRVLRASARAASQYFIQVRGIPHGEMDYHDLLVNAIEARDLDKATALLKDDIREIM